jgi:signal transduction histidine kinase
MLPFGDQSIKSKLTLFGILSSSSALILACAAFVVHDLWTFRDSMVQRLSTQAKIVGFNSTAALLFKDPKTASEILTALSAEPDIVLAGVYARDGNLFARYARDGELFVGDTSLPGFLDTRIDGHRFEWNYLELFQTIHFEGMPIGRVAIRASLTTLKVWLLSYLGIAALVLLASVLGSAFVSLKLQQKISAPILELVKKTKTISQDKSSAVHPTIERGDEVALLVETFNQMLARIQKQTKDLQEARDELERRVMDRTAQLETANKELEAFSYSVSHDLRAPLRGIDGFSQALLEDYADRLDGEGKDYLQRVRAATQRMAQLIDDMLDLSRVTRGEMTREAVDLSALAQSTAAELRKSEPDRGVKFIIAQGIQVDGDPRLLQIALENLLGNAWKFTGKKPQATIEVGVSHDNGKPVYFVRDNGAGFDMTYAGKMFGAFQRFHGAADFKGTGIGLATVQRIVHRHGGRVWAEARVEQGATFYFTL